MTLDTYTRLPTSATVVKCLADALGTRTGDKDIYDIAKNSPMNLDYRKSRKILEKEVLQVLRSAELLAMAHEIERIYDRFENDYLLNIIPKITIAGIDGKEQYGVIIQYIFCLPAYHVLKSLTEKFSGPDIFQLLVSADEAVPFMLRWLKENDDLWRKKPASLQCNSGDSNDGKILSQWGSGKILPTFCRINSLKAEEKIASLLIIARAIQFATSYEIGKKIVDGLKHVCFSINPGNFFEETLSIIERKRREKFQRILQIFNTIQSLKKTTIREKDKNEYAVLVKAAQKIIHDEGLEDIAQGYLDYCNALMHILSGDMKKAVEPLESALEWALYRDGPFTENCLYIIMRVASAQTPPDKILLKRAKNLLLTFGHDIPAVSADTLTGRNRSEDIIEDWEIANWARGYKKQSLPDLPMIMIDLNSLHTPDYRYPDRRFTVAEGVRYPQLCYYICLKKIDIVKKLLEKKADVSAATSSGDTPLSISIRHIIESDDKSYFDLIASDDNAKKTINERTRKKRKTALLLAIETGDPAIVQKILDLGADPNLRGETDWQTPLYRALSVYAQQVKPLDKSQFLTMENSPYGLDAIRRYTNGFFGQTLQDQQIGIRNLRNSERRQKIFDACYDFMIAEKKKINPEDRLQIISILLAHGADSNAEHKTDKIRHYTPLALACELDLASIVAEMLKKYNGNRDTTIKYKYTDKCFTLYDIAEGHGASAVKEVLVTIHFQ